MYLSVKQEVVSYWEATNYFFEMTGDSIFDHIYYLWFSMTLFCMKSVIPEVPKVPGNIPHFPNKRGDPYFA